MASYKQLQLFVDKELDHCLQSVFRPFTEHVYFPEISIDPLEIEKHHQEIQLQNLSISDTLACVTCQTQFTDRTEQILHFKSDWHRFNLKRKLRNQPSFSSEKFEAMEKDISSISGSDSSSDEFSGNEGPTNTSLDDSYSMCARNNPKIILTLNDGRHLSLYRCLLHGKKNIPQESQELIVTARGLPFCIHWCIVMAAGGHFAMALFERDKIIQHKTFHKYIIRAKQGSAQTVHDQKTGGKGRSAGANLRRQNMLHLKQKIQELFITWKNEVERCSLIFVRAPSFNQQLLFGDKNPPVSTNDSRVRSIPFATLRPTFNEIKRVYDQLTKMELYPEDYQFQKVEQEKPAVKLSAVIKSKTAVCSLSDSEDDLNGDIKQSTSRKKLKPQSIISTTATDRKLLVAEDLSIFNELFTACRLNDTQRFDDIIAQLRDVRMIDRSSSIVDIVNYQTVGSLDTLLHICSERGHLKLIQRLLNEGANPALSNQRGKYPYNLCKNKETKEIFRLFRHEHPDKYDYTLGQIAPSISPNELDRQRAAERERRRQTKKRRSDKQRSDRERQLREQEEEQQRVAFLRLSDAEKRALAIHVNFETNKRDELHLGRCWQCGQKISDEPFTYFDYKFCSTTCLKTHRTKSKTAATNA